MNNQFWKDLAALREAVRLLEKKGYIKKPAVSPFVGIAEAIALLDKRFREMLGIQESTPPTRLERFKKWLWQQKVFWIGE